MVNHGKTSIEVDYPTASNFVRETCLAIWYNAPGLLLAGFLFGLVSFPSFWFIHQDLPLMGVALVAAIIVPAWLAVLAYIGGFLKRLDTGMGFLPKLFFRYYRRGIIFGFLLCIPFVSTFWCIPVLFVVSDNPIIWLFLIAGIVVLAILATLFIYIPSLIVLYDLELSTALRNAIALSGQHIWNTIGLLGMGVLFALAILHINSGLVFFLPAIWGVFIVNNCRMVIAEEQGQNR
jgi:hypothetical protein